MQRAKGEKDPAAFHPWRDLNGSIMSEHMPAQQHPWPPSAIASRPRLGWADFALLMWRAKWLMIAVFVPIFAFGLFVAVQFQPSYTAGSRLLATLDDFYVYRPLAGGAAAGETLEQAQIIQAELELMRSPVVFEAVIAEYEIGAIYPAIEKARRTKLALRNTDRATADAEAQAAAIEALADAFHADAGPQTPIIDTRLTHRDPVLAAQLLNDVIAAYLAYRAELLTESSGQGFADQRVRFEAELATIDAELNEFRSVNGFSDLDAERGSIQRLIEKVTADLLAAEIQTEAARGQVSALGQQLDSTSQDVDLFVEDTSRQRLAELRLEREDLLSRYTETASPVVAISARIAQIEAYLMREPQLRGTVRRGPNPVHQALETNQLTAVAEARAAGGAAAALAEQLIRLQARQNQLVDLMPQWDDLLRRRDVAVAGVRDYAERESEAKARSALAQSDGDNIRVLEPARAPLEGSSLRMPVAALSFLFAGFCALVGGLLFVFTRRGFATPQSLTRSTGVPVLAAIGPMRSASNTR